MDTGGGGFGLVPNSLRNAKKAKEPEVAMKRHHFALGRAKN